MEKNQNKKEKWSKRSKMKKYEENLRQMKNNEETCLKNWNEKNMKKTSESWRKMKKMKKMKKNEENDEIWFQTQNPRRFPGFAVAVVTFFRRNPRRFPWFHLGMCLFPEENQQPILGSHRFPRKSEHFLWTWTKTRIFPTKIDETIFAKVSSSNKKIRQTHEPFSNNCHNNNPIWENSVLTSEVLPPHSEKLNHALSQVGGPTQSQLSRPMSSRHHISMEHRLRRKHPELNSDTDASNETYLKYMKKRKRRNIFLRNKWKKKERKMKNMKAKSPSNVQFVTSCPPKPKKSKFHKRKSSFSQ